MRRKSKDVSMEVVAMKDRGLQSMPTHQEIAARAYELFMARGQSHGSDLEDWLRAETELRGTVSLAR
jgi:hypothetical protein